MTPREKELLIESDTFCMLPWMHLHAYPDGRAYPCCFAWDPYPVGNLNKNSMEEVFNGEKMNAMRGRMLDNKKSRECMKCYDQEKSGFFSLRLSSNKHFGHNIPLVHNTLPDGKADFVMKYWDIRFSNLCNMACRSCGTWFSSNWYEDHKKLTGSPPPHAKDFYISSTVGLVNSLHVTDFHRSWVEQGLIKPADFNFNLLQHPAWQRMDILPPEYKQQVKEKYESHIQWLKDKDPLTRATKGFESAINWMLETDNQKHLDLHIEQTKKYDKMRNEKTLEVFPEWTELFSKYDKNKT